MPDPDWWQTLWPDPRSVLLALGVEEGMDAVDLCCGDGWFTAPLALIARRALAVDIDEVMLGRAKERVAMAGAVNCAFVTADAYDVADLMPWPADFVLMANTFHGVPDKPRLARALTAVLRPGGHSAIVNWHRHPREETVVLGQARGPKTEMRMPPMEVRTIIEPAGLRHIRTVDLPPYHYGAVFARPDLQPVG